MWYTHLNYNARLGITLRMSYMVYNAENLFWVALLAERRVHKSDLVSMFTASLFGNIAKCERKAYKWVDVRIWTKAQIRRRRSPSWPFPGYSAHIDHISSLHRGWPYHHRMWYLETFEPNFQNNEETLNFQQISSNIWLKKEFWPLHHDNDLQFSIKPFPPL